MKIICAAFFLHLCIGSVYGWSCLLLPITNVYGYSIPAVQFCFSLAIFFLGTNACFFGKYIEEFGPRKSALIATGLFTFGMIATGFVLPIQIGGLISAYLTYGVCLGSALGIAYVAPISSLLKAIPEHKAFAGSIAIFGFGLGAWVFAPIATYLIEATSIPMMFTILGTIYFCIMFISSMMLPKSNYTDIKKFNVGITRYEALHTKSFYLFWLMLFINIFCGISLISVASPLCQQVLGMDVMAAALIVAYIGVFNGIGRPLWAIIADNIGRKQTYRLIFVGQIITIIALMLITDPLVFQMGLYLLATMYGAGFAMAPALVQDLFGMKHVSSIHGAILFSWAWAGMLGPLFISLINNIFATYVAIFPVFIGLFIIAMLCTFGLKKEYKE